MTKYTLEVEILNDGYCDDCLLYNTEWDKCRATDTRFEWQHRIQSQPRPSNCPLVKIEDKRCENCRHWFNDGGFDKGWSYCKKDSVYVSTGGYSGSLTTFKDFCCKFWEKKDALTT